jgi:large subunit ribosomal protein L25
MELQKLEASLRKRSGKGPARRLRHKGLVPAVLYGQGVDTQALALDPKSLVKALSGPRRTNTILELDIVGAESSGPCTAMVKDHQYDPVSRQLLHVDFYAVSMEEKIKVKVPLEVVGRSAGEQLGGTLAKLFRALPLECLPADIPVSIKVDVTELGVNQMITAKDIATPKDVTLLLDDKMPVLSVLAKRVESEEAKEEGAAEAGEQAAEEKPASESNSESPSK